MVEEERKTYAKLEREKLTRRIKNREERRVKLQTEVPNDSLVSFKAFKKIYKTKANLSFTNQSRFITSAMVRLKMLIKEEATDADGNVVAKPDKTINPTRIIADSKIGGHFDKKKCLGKLLNGVRALISFRNSL